MAKRSVARKPHYDFNQEIRSEADTIVSRQSNSEKLHERVSSFLRSLVPLDISYDQSIKLIDSYKEGSQSYSAQFIYEEQEDIYDANAFDQQGERRVEKGSSLIISFKNDKYRLDSSSWGDRLLNRYGKKTETKSLDDVLPVFQKSVLEMLPEDLRNQAILKLAEQQEKDLKPVIQTNEMK